MAGECNGRIEELELQELSVTNDQQGKRRLKLRGSFFGRFDNKNNKAIYCHITLFCDQDYLIDKIVAMAQTYGLPFGQIDNTQQGAPKIFLSVPFRRLTWDMYVDRNNVPRPTASAALDGPVWLVQPQPKMQKQGQQQGQYPQQAPQGQYPQQQAPPPQTGGWGAPPPQAPPQAGGWGAPPPQQAPPQQYTPPQGGPPGFPQAPPQQPVAAPPGTWQQGNPWGTPAGAQGDSGRFTG